VRTLTDGSTRPRVTLLWRCGLRISECLALRLSDIDFERGTLRVRRGKAAKPRTVGLDALASTAIEAWLAKRPAGSGPLFTLVSDASRPVHSEHVRNKLKRLARRAGIDRRVHPHQLRHCYAVELIQEGADPMMVRDLLGHASLASTDAYLREWQHADS
jgi:integrase/recombinase XerD